ncbi:MAG: carbon storage regulator CsrA [Planctomycetes bacterium]|nr:carbon storage regulator CsrA [Planctomycetota bacterium]
MLVLSRKKDESVILGDNITVTVIEIRGDKVRLGFDHPREMSVHRKEIHDAILAESAADAPPVTPLAAASFAQSAKRSRAAPSGRNSSRPASLLDRVVAALQARTDTAISREVLTQAIAEATVQELSTEVLRSASPELLKTLLLEALNARE